MNEKINEIEPQDIEDFLKECLAEAEKIGVSLNYYLEEFV